MWSCVESIWLISSWGGGRFPDKNFHLVCVPVHREYRPAVCHHGLDLSREKDARQVGMNWNNRSDRLARIQEREQFKKIFMPLAYGVALLGGLVLLGGFLMQCETGRWNLQILATGKILLLAPLPLWIFRFYRGHYSSRLRD